MLVCCGLLDSCGTCSGLLGSCRQLCCSLLDNSGFIVVRCSVVGSFLVVCCIVVGGSVVVCLVVLFVGYRCAVVNVVGKEVVGIFAQPGFL